MVNPVQPSGDQSLTDQKDSATAAPRSAYAKAQMRNLDGSGNLSGKWVSIRSNTVPAARATYDKALTRDGLPAADLVRAKFADRHITF